MTCHPGNRDVCCLEWSVIDTLNRLSNAPDGLGFTELKAKLNVSGASLVNRLNKLKDVEYITINAKTGKKSRAHVAYALTQSGVEPVDTLDVPTLLEKVENQFAT